MSIKVIRAALETHLAAMPGLGLPIAFENVDFVRPTSGPYAESRTLIADPDGAQLGSLMFFERGIYQITLCYPSGRGTGDAETKAMQIRDWFSRGTTLVRSGIQTIIMEVPSVRAGFPDNGFWRMPVSANWQAQVSA